MGFYEWVDWWFLVGGWVLVGGWMGVCEWWVGLWSEKWCFMVR